MGVCDLVLKSLKPRHKTCLFPYGPAVITYVYIHVIF